jgi:hypothetical protein
VTGTADAGAVTAAAAIAATLALLDQRAATATICPSEVARAVAAAAGPPASGAAEPDWRGTMPTVHAAVDILLAAGRVRLSWKGAPMAQRDGPYRIARAGGDAATVPTD